MTPEELIKGLRDVCGYVENGTDRSVKITQDDATKDWIIRVGNEPIYGNSFESAIENAIRKHGDDWKY